MDTQQLCERILKSKNPMDEISTIMNNMRKALEAANRLCFQLEHDVHKSEIMKTVKTYRELENSI